MNPSQDLCNRAYLDLDGPSFLDVDLAVDLQTGDGSVTRIVRANARDLYYSASQQLVHHASSGCPMRVGDLLGSGTISGREADQFGALLELTWGGERPILLGNGESRTFLEDGDEVIFSGAAHAADHRIGFGTCRGHVEAAE